MATSNDTWPFLVRYYSASSVYGTNEHQCLRGLEELLEDDQLPASYRLRANVFLAHAARDWVQSQGYRLTAEQAYSEISTSGLEDGDFEETELASLREDLDSLAEKERCEFPRLRDAEQLTIKPTTNGQASEEQSSQATLPSSVQDVSQERIVQNESSSDDVTKT